MYFSAKEYHSYINNQRGSSRYKDQLLELVKPSAIQRNDWGGIARRNIDPDTYTFSMSEARKGLRKIKQAVIERNIYFNDNGRTFHVGKWLRPWHVVPQLKNFRAPAGDYGVGVEVELGFINLNAAKTVAFHIRNWKYITLDWEGGAYGIETTFAPVLYSKLNNKSQCFRYLNYLQENQSLVVRHDPGSTVGTHVNVSGHRTISNNYHYIMSSLLRESLTQGDHYKYFGRRPYGYLFPRGNMVEFKLFNSTTDPVVLRRYIDIAVQLYKLLETLTSPPTLEQVIEALERGYNGVR